MKVIKIIYDNETKFILDVPESLEEKVIIETYNISDYREKKNALPIMTRHGTTKVPLVVLENENLDEYAAVWSEENPDWVKEITKKLLND